MRYVDKASAWLVCIIGALHLAVGHAAFTAPSEPRTWFASAGFLLVVTGLANIAAQGGTGNMQNAAALAGSSSILILGALIAMSDRNLLTQPQTLVLLALGLILTVQRMRGIRVQHGTPR
jgi:uncharacterized membrane protein YecN with MAPEG domain